MSPSKLLSDVALDESGSLQAWLNTPEGLVEFRFHPEGRERHEVLEQGEQLAIRFPELLTEARRCLVRDLLPVVNGGYLPAGEPPIAVDRFLDRAGLPSVDVYEEMVEFIFADDDMLWGHFMVVTRDGRGQVSGSVFG